MVPWIMGKFKTIFVACLVLMKNPGLFMGNNKFYIPYSTLLQSVSYIQIYASRNHSQFLYYSAFNGGVTKFFYLQSTSLSRLFL
jgi:hypothetical protein